MRNVSFVIKTFELGKDEKREMKYDPSVLITNVKSYKRLYNDFAVYC